MRNELDIRVEQSPGCATVHARGEIDMETTPPLRDCLAAQSGYVTIDLSEVTFLDSTGLSAIALQRRRLVAAGGDLDVRAPHDIVLRALQITGLDALVRIDDQ